VDVPGEVLKAAESLRVQVAFDDESGETTVHEAVIVRLGVNRRLERITLHLDLEVKGKG
jgi:hypothetical protein